MSLWSLPEQRSVQMVAALRQHKTDLLISGSKCLIYLDTAQNLFRQFTPKALILLDLIYSQY